MNKRYEELDSLRGLAAVSVVFSHLAFILPSIYLIAKLENTPLHIFWAGHEAVILFFILSGFVLSLPYFNNKEPSYKNYIIKRICRIYIPYLVSIVLAIVCMNIFYGSNIPEMSEFFNKLAQITPISSELIINHLFMLNEFNTDAFNGVIWSLIHEMRISIVFPFIVYLVKKYDWKRNIVIALSCSFIYFLLYYSFLKILKYDMTINLSSYFITIHYIAFFILGSLLAKHRDAISEHYKKLANSTRISIIVLGVLFYTYTYWFPMKTSILHISVIEDWSIAIGGSLFIIFCLNSNMIRSVMLFRPIHFVGKISYSLYLCHLIVMFTMIHVMYGKLPIGLILLGSFVLSFIVASIMYFTIEKPSIKLGKFLTRKRAPKVNRNVEITEKQYV